MFGVAPWVQSCRSYPQSTCLALPLQSIAKGIAHPLTASESERVAVVDVHGGVYRECLRYCPCIIMPSRFP